MTFSHINQTLALTHETSQALDCNLSLKVVWINPDLDPNSYLHKLRKRYSKQKYYKK